MHQGFRRFTHGYAYFLPEVEDGGQDCGQRQETQSSITIAKDSVGKHRYLHHQLLDPLCRIEESHKYKDALVFQVRGP